MCIFGASQVSPRIRLIVIFDFGCRLDDRKVHLVDASFFWDGASLQFFPYTSRGRFRWREYCNATNADRIVHCGRLYHSGNEERRRSHRRLITRARRRAEFDLYAATDAPLWRWLVKQITMAIKFLSVSVVGGVDVIIGR